MFPTIRAEVARKGISYGDLAEIVDISKPALSLKLKGEREFKRSEMLAIRDALAPDMTLDKMFETDDDEAIRTLTR